MGTLTYDEAISLLEAAVVEKGEDYVYPDDLKVDDVCQYFVDGKPACIVGNVLAQLGHTADEFEPNEGLAIDEVFMPIDASSPALAALKRAQRAQDTGDPWGTALKRAKRVYA